MNKEYKIIAVFTFDLCKKWLFTLLWLGAWIFTLGLSALPQEVSGAVCSTCFPTDTGMVNVKQDYLAVGDGNADDTQALQTAISNHVGNIGKPQTLYLPPGTYSVCGSLEWKDGGGNWGAFLSIQGAGRAETIIKLKDGCSGFGNVSIPEAVLHTASSGSTTSNGSGGSGFRINIADLTIDVGENNPGAVGIDFIGNNQASIENVLIRAGSTSGHTGIALWRQFPGPSIDQKR